MALGALCVALAYVIMAGAVIAAQGDESSWWWLAGYFALISIGELQVAPIGLSFISKATPARMRSTMMGLWLAVSFAGGLIAGRLAGFWSEMDKASYFLLIAGIAALAAGLMLACAWLSGSAPARPVTQAPPPDPR
jgi:POT family proton-dependent oligopeptide transporter